jgi:ABC-type nitrate/sulfonate/bicarbonate transport system permease component
MTDETQTTGRRKAALGFIVGVALGFVLALGIAREPKAGPQAA